MPLVENGNKLKLIKNRRWWLISAIILFVLIVYTIAWFVLANKVEDKVSSQIIHSQQRGIEFLCENLHKTGYPLRIGVSCDTFSARRSMQGFSFSSERLTAGAPVYAPHLLEISAKSPVSLEMPDLVPLAAKWDSFTVVTDIGKAIPDSIKLITEGLSIGEKAEAETVIQSTEAKFLRIDLKGLNDNLEARVTFDELQLPYTMPHENTALPKLDGDMQLAFDNIGEILNDVNQNDWNKRFYNHSGVIDHAKLTFASGGAIDISGPFSFDDEGYLSAQFEIAISNQSDMQRTARMLFPSQAENLKTVFFAVSAMPSNKNGDPVLSLRVKHGEARLGFIKLGRINPI